MKMNAFAMIIAPIILLSSCHHAKEEARPMAAQAAAQDVRTGWDRSVKPIAIEIEECPEGLSEIGAKAVVKDAMPEEQAAFQSARFKKKGSLFLADNPHAVTLDTAAAVSICAPGRGSDEITLSAPLTENLYGIEISRCVNPMVCNENGDTVADEKHAFVSRFKLASSVAALQIVTASDNICDMLDRLRIYGDGLATSATYKPYSGEWSDAACGGYIESTTAGCLMTNGREHNIYLVPMAEPAQIQVFATVNGKEMSVKTTLPPMSAGSLTRLNLTKEDDKLKITGSWVATKRPIAFKEVQRVDTVKPGHYLRNDGYITAKFDNECVAMVVETDGRHGKAVALTDSEGEFSWSLGTSGFLFPTVDGERKEGRINPAASDNVNAENRIVFIPNVSYPTETALGFSDGAMLTSFLLKSHTRPDESCMLTESQRHPGAYVPSAQEMAQLFYCFNPLKGRYDWTERLAPPEGRYLTSSESSYTTVYVFDFNPGVLTGSSSKQYTKARLRLFYRF